MWINKLIDGKFRDGFRFCNPYKYSPTWFCPILKRGICRIDFAFMDKKLPNNWFVSHKRIAGLSDHAQVVINIKSHEFMNNNDNEIILPSLRPRSKKRSADSTPKGEEILPQPIPDEQIFGVNYDEIMTAQRDENQISGKIIKFLEEGIMPASKEEQKVILGHAKTMTIKNKLLYFISESPYFDVRRGPIRRALFIPEKFRRKILEILHDDLFAGHFGYDKMLPTVLDRFWWPNIGHDLRNHVDSCETCQKSKDIPKKIGFYRSVPLGENPWERVGINILGPLKMSKKGNSYVVVLTDYFTRWADAFAGPAIDAETVAKVIVEECFCRFGIPLVLQSDQGQPFVSELL